MMPGSQLYLKQIPKNHSKIKKTTDLNLII